MEFDNENIVLIIAIFVIGITVIEGIVVFIFMLRKKKQEERDRDNN